MSYSWRRQTVVAVSLLVGFVASSAYAEPRQTFELEPVAFYVSPGSYNRAQIFVVSYTYGGRFGHVIPYVGGAIGFFTFQARAGITWLPGDLEEPGFMLRLEARPQTAFGNCWEPSALGSLGAGFRWPLERGDPGYPGTAAFLLPAFTGGIGYLHPTCQKENDGPLESRGLLGASLTGGLDF